MFIIVGMNALQKAIDEVGSQSALAKSIGCVPQVVNNWLRRCSVPAERCPSIEKATNGAVRCEDLRPDVDWAYLRNSEKGEAQIKAPPLVIPIECASSDPRHGERRRQDLRKSADRRAEDA